MAGFRHVLLAALILALGGCALSASTRCGAGETPAAQDSLYFGTARPGGVVTPAEWRDFLRRSVTPRFPRGFTVWRANGQWTSANGAAVKERTYVLSLVHPDDLTNEAAVRVIAADYKARFHQEAVLRVRSDACMSF